MSRTNASTRLEGLDLARYLAFFGMVIVNFKVAMGVEGGDGVWEALSTALEGRAAATFVVLAGLGLGLSAGARLTQTRSVTFKRAAFLMALGLMNMTLFDADILHFYAVYFALGVLFLACRTGTVLATVAALNIVFLLLILIFDYDAGWDWETYTYSDLWTLRGFLRHLFFNGWHPVIPWLGFLLFGIVLSRAPLGDRKTQVYLLAGGAAALIASKALSGLLTPMLARIDPELAVLAQTGPIPPMPLYTVAGLGAACLCIGACLLLTPLLSRIGFLRAVTPAGRQTLTLYIAHILIGMGILEMLGLLDGQSSGQTPGLAVGTAVVFCACATVYAWLWSRHFKRGPIEAVMRKIAG